MDVEFKDLCYQIPGPRWKPKVRPKTILRNVSGCFRPGQLSAIMGPSGAGKSSLLNAISGYNGGVKPTISYVTGFMERGSAVVPPFLHCNGPSSTGVSGELYSNGEPRNERLFRKCSCYITQDDLLQPFLTLKELMMFAARLKLPSSMSHKERRHIVSDIIDNIGLSNNQHTFTENLSGGQKKRLSIALELINNPPVFFLDEPTSGLDNVSTKQCLIMLRKLAQQNRTLVCTIHQPSASIFEMFDLIYVVSQGVCVYQGTTSGLLPFLSSVGLHCPLSYNPADYVIEITDGEEAHNVQFLSNAICNGKVMWKETSSDDIITDCMTTLLISDAHVNGVKDSKMNGNHEFKDNSLEKQMSGLEYANSPWSQFCTILGRMMLQIGRNRTSLWIQLIHHILCSSLLGLVFYDCAQDGHQWFVHLKVIIAVVVFHTYTWTLVPVLTYPNEVKLLQREHFNRWYKFSSYYAALTMSTIPAKVFFSLIFLTNIYYLVGLPFEVLRFSLFCFIGVLTSLVAEGMGFAIGAAFSVTNGAAVGPAIIAPFLGLAVYGFDFAKQIPTVVNIIMRASFIRGGVVAMAITVFGLDRPILGCSDSFGYCHFRDPKVLMEMLDFTNRPLWFELLILFCMLLGFRLAFFIILRMRLKT